MVIQPRASLQILLVWVLLVCNAPVALALDTNERIEQEARALLELSKEQNNENHSLAIRTASRALELWRTLDNKTGIAEALFYIGQYQSAKGDLTDAKQTLEEALELWRQQDNLEEQAATLIQLGYLEHKKGEWPNAIEYYTQAQALVGGDGSPSHLARIASGLAEAFIESGLPRDALTQYQRALNYFEQAGHEHAVSRMTMQIGHTYLLLGDETTALTHLRQALSRFKPNSIHAAECNEYLAQLHLSKGEFARARRRLEQSLRSYERAENLIEAARVRALIGQVYEQQGVVAGARAHYLEALKTFRTVEDRVSEAAISFALGRLELRQGNLDQAEDFLRRSIEHTEEIRSVSVGRYIATAFSANVHNRYAAYIHCLLLKHKLHPSLQLDVRAFEASELARARSLAEFLRDTQTNLLAGLDPGLAEQEKKLRQLIREKIDARTSRLATEFDETDLKEIEASLTELRRQQQQLAEKLRNLSPSYEQLTRPTNHSLSEIQNHVIEDDETALVEYILGEDASYAWIVTRNSIRVFELPKEELIEDAVGKAYELLKQLPNKDTKSELNKATAELSKLILSPLTEDLQVRRMIVVADAALNYIPFQLLPHPVTQQPLIESYEIVNAPSASILGQLRDERKKRSPHDKVLVAFGDPAFPKRPATPLKAQREIRVAGDSLEDDQLEPLFYAKHELNALKEIAGAHSYIVSDYDASRETFERTELSQYAILHLATHGRFRHEKPESSGFFLSMVDANQRPLNGFMSLQDVYSLKAPVDLVVLSACRTALGKDVRGEGLIGLTRGFMHAGALSVAASLWSVDDEATAMLMKHFYSNMLNRGMTPAEALRAAQNTIRQDPLLQEPYYWAAFTLQGEYNLRIALRPTEPASRTTQTIIAISLILAFLAAVGWFYRRRRNPTN